MVQNRLWHGVVAALALGACVSPYEGDTPDQRGEQKGFEQTTHLFEEQGETGGERTVRFHTNDVRYWSEYGYTVWTVWGESEAEEFTGRTVKMSKAKGFAGACYGLVICEGKRMVEGEAKVTMLTVMINNEGQYALGKVIDGRYEAVLDLTRTVHLNRGVGAPNTIWISRDGGVFSMYVNGVFERSFTDSREPVYYEGRNGYIVVIAPVDRFPEGEVDVYFTERR
jgi:hypothetical protein